MVSWEQAPGVSRARQRRLCILTSIPRIEDLLGRAYACVCGRTHRVGTRAVDVAPGAIDRFPGHLRALGLPEDILLVADRNTWAAAGSRVAGALRAAGMAVRSHILPGQDLHVDEWSVGSVMIAAEPHPALLVAVGSGTINDLTRFCATRMGLPYAVFATAPSVDGFASTVVPVLNNYQKVTYGGVCAQLISAEPAVLAAAPRSLIAAGLGDVLGKLTARLDWMLGETVMGEHRCPVLVAMVDQSVERCLALAPELAGGGEEAVTALMDSLTLVGLAMQMQGDSRPASGSEHHLSHFLEMRDIIRHRPVALHGDKVGVAALTMMRLYERFFAAQPPPPGPPENEADWQAGMERVYGPIAPAMMEISRGLRVSREEAERRFAALLPRWDFFREQAARLPALREAGARALRAAGGPDTWQALGYDRQDVADALRYAKEVRDRYTLLCVLKERGCLDAMVEDVLDELFQ